MTRTPLHTIEEALDRGFHMEDIRSDRNGVDVDLRCGHKLLTVHLTREDARRDLRRDVTKPLFG